MQIIATATVLQPCAVSMLDTVGTCFLILKCRPKNATIKTRADEQH